MSYHCRRVAGHLAGRVAQGLGFRLSSALSSAAATRRRRGEEEEEEGAGGNVRRRKVLYERACTGALCGRAVPVLVHPAAHAERG